MDGIFQVITLLLGLSGFGVAPNPKPPTPEASLAYAIAEPDLVAHIDVASLVPNNYKLLTTLADQPQIQAAPDVAKLVRQAVDEIEGARGLAKTMTGIDLVTDITDATAFMSVLPHGRPNAIVAVHGKLAPGVIENIARMSGQTATKHGGASVADLGDTAVALTKDGVLLFGTPAAVHERIADGWRAPSHAAGTTLGRIAEQLAQKPVFALAMALSQAARDDATKNLERGVALDILRRHRLAVFAVFHDGVGWTWVDSTKDGLDQFAQMSDGFVQLLRGSQIAVRGLAKIGLAALESYRGDSRIDALLGRKADLLKIIDAYVGDGTFRVKVDTDAKALRHSVRLVGHGVADVLPLGALVPLGALGAWMMMGRRAEAQPPAAIAVPAQALPPAPASSSSSWPRSH